MTEQEVEGVFLVELECVVDGVLPVEGGHSVVAVLDGAWSCALIVAHALVVVVLSVAAVGTVDREERLSSEAFDGSELDVSAADETCGLTVALVVLSLIHKRVDVCGIHGVWCLIDLAVVRTVGVGDGGHLACCIEEGSAVVVTLIGEGGAHADSHDAVDLMIEVESSVVTVECVVLEQSLVVHGCCGSRESGLLIATADAGLVVLRGGVLHECVVPVGVAAVVDDVEL